MMKHTLLFNHFNGLTEYKTQHSETRETSGGRRESRMREESISLLREENPTCKKKGEAWAYFLFHFWQGHLSP